MSKKALIGDDGSLNYGATAISSDQLQHGVSFHNLSYTVRGLFSNKTGKVILNDLSGVLPPGLNAIMGPTGSGKTSLLDILADRKGKKGIGGSVLVNGARQPKNFKCMSGYVVQDDMVMGTLTVKENLYFSAALRLPISIPWSRKKQLVKKVIDELGLNMCADTKIGTEFFRGVSGGERKRTNIGMELIIEPQVLFLDEPTTGLDAFTAISVVQLLRNLSRANNRVIIMSIHQPRYSIFKLCDNLTLLSRGEMVYHGPSNKALEYFSELGYYCEEHDNPADFFLDLINKCEGQMSATSDLLAIENGDGATNPTDLCQAYTESQVHHNVMKECQLLLNGADTKNTYNRGRYATNFLWQLLIVIVRSTVNLARNPMTSFLQLIITVIFSLAVGGIYYQLDTGDNGYQNRIGAIFFIIMNQIFGNLSAIDLFIRQKALFIHENASGYYRVSAYFFAKVICDVIPMRLIPLCFFAVISYFMIGFQINVVKFFVYFLTLFLTAISASSIAFFVSAGVNVAGMANLLVALFFVIQMLFGGFLLALTSLPTWIRWLQYVSLFRYAVEAIAVNEIQGLTFLQQFENGTVNGTINVTGDALLARQGYKPSWLWYDQIGLGGLCLIFLSLTYITLRAIKKEK